MEKLSLWVSDPVIQALPLSPVTTCFDLTYQQAVKEHIFSPSDHTNQATKLKC